ncbi:MAG: endonuclease V [Bacteroidota bacterium]
MSSPDQLRFAQEQAKLLQRLRIPSDKEAFILSPGDLLISIDIQYQGNWGYVALDVMAWPAKSSQLYVSKEAVTVPYVPGYFAFREGPALLSALQKLSAQYDLQPSLILVDGHGTAHPRRMGLASWLGIQSGVPSMGVAKEPLIKQPYKLAEEVESFVPVKEGNEVIGHILRTRHGVKPVFVSAGHLISQASALDFAIALRSQYRILAPIRRADQAARAFAKGMVDEVIVLEA